jgi:hypothetical protein
MCCSDIELWQEHVHFFLESTSSKLGYKTHAIDGDRIRMPATGPDGQSMGGVRQGVGGNGSHRWDAQLNRIVVLTNTSGCLLATPSRLDPVGYSDENDAY